MTGIAAHFHLRQGQFTLDAAFVAPPVQVTALFGPSGSGKTTVLRCLAGLTRAEGRLTVHGEVWQDARTWRPTHHRPLGYVFQEPSLLPHLSVRDNLTYGMNRVPVAARQVTLDDVVDWLRLRPLLDRRLPTALSGGEQQRVAIGRALLTSPRLLLMDEPVSALDAAGKAEVLACLERLQRAWTMPVVYVTHALDEVARLADHVVVLDHGRVVAEGPLQATLARLDAPLAGLEDALAVLPMTVAAQDDAYHQTRLTCPGGELWVAQLPLPVGTPVRARLRAGDVGLATERPTQTTVSNALHGTILGMQDGPADAVVVQVDIAGAPLLARVTKRSRDRLGLQVGQPVWALVKAVAVVA